MNLRSSMKQQFCDQYRYKYYTPKNLKMTTLKFSKIVKKMLHVNEHIFVAALQQRVFFIEL